MRRLSVLVAAAAVALIAGCGGASSTKNATSTSVPAGGNASSSSGQTTSGRGTGPPKGSYDLTLTGAVSGAMKPGGAGFINCYGGGAPKGPGFEAGIGSQLNGANSVLDIRQNTFSEGTVTFPAAGTVASEKDVTVRLTSTANQNTNWVMSSGYGSGTLSLTGGKGSAVSGTIDGELAQLPSGAAVHVKGTFTCTSA